MSESNGLATIESIDDLINVGDAAVLEDAPQQKRTRGKNQKRVKVSRLKIDAGNGRIKFLADGYFDAIRSVISQVSSPQSMLGAFDWDSKSWLVGADAEIINNSKQRIEVGTTPGAKVKYFPHMVLGAIASHPTFLDGATRFNGDRTRKHLSIDIDCLALARGEELFNNLQKVKEFSKDGITYQTEWRYFIAHPEGYGGAIAAHKLIKEKDPKTRQFYILDIGNGTITLTPYNCFGSKPLAGIPRSGSGGGVIAIVDKFSETANTGDHETIYLDQLRKALERSKVVGDKYQAIVAGSRNDLGASLATALQDWKDKHPATRKVLREVDDVLLDGDYVFCCGGGFEIPPIEDFVKSQFPNSDRLIVLPNPGTISLLGLKEENS
ncbi:hypothetical protein H6G33_17590 [Calothrix sp. FACHB-1219]|uniref:hypothetical protein n=1 Tax=unclassified Calothrix TaxID=2619626 RepID=UPI0016880AE0|nr:MULTISPECIES: hypothetical protein [unclassified Calothrix]MBD2202692.1 hypothetical protein [Calothrix sp. FACHB-168]MBD2218845.1 hypothetical protein [Calothrix sp. FACHB-1219]